MSRVDEYLKDAYDAHSVESYVREMTVDELIEEIADKVKTYGVRIFIGRYTYIVFEDCKYILNNNFYQTNIKHLCHKQTKNNGREDVVVRTKHPVYSKVRRAYLIRRKTTP